MEAKTRNKTERRKKRELLQKDRSDGRRTNEKWWEINMCVNTKHMHGIVTEDWPSVRVWRRDAIQRNAGPRRGARGENEHTRTQTLATLTPVQSGITLMETFRFVWWVYFWFRSTFNPSRTEFHKLLRTYCSVCDGWLWIVFFFFASRSCGFVESTHARIHLRPPCCCCCDCILRMPAHKRSGRMQNPLNLQHDWHERKRTRVRACVCARLAFSSSAPTTSYRCRRVHRRAIVRKYASFRVWNCEWDHFFVDIMKHDSGHWMKNWITSTPYFGWSDSRGVVTDDIFDTRK